MTILAVIFLFGEKWWKIENSLDKNTWRFRAKLKMPHLCKIYCTLSTWPLSVLQIISYNKTFLKRFLKENIGLFYFSRVEFFVSLFVCFFFFSRYIHSPFFSFSEMSNCKPLAKQKPIGHLNWDARISPKYTAKRLDYILHFIILLHITRDIWFLNKNWASVSLFREHAGLSTNGMNLQAGFICNYLRHLY